ncbi:MAG: helix-turn-helix domain-containing protein, partial [Candidatus Sericytochromatia bacterium]
MNQVLAPDRSFTAATIGSLLQAARQQRGLSLEEIAQRTFIKLHYLQALEEGLFDRLPAPVYTSGYIRQVARMLGLDDVPLIQQYHQNRQNQI